MTLDALTWQTRSAQWKKPPTGRVGNQADSGNKEVNQTRLKGAVKELEALFIFEMLKEMRQTTQGGFLGKGMGNEVYGSLFDMEMAKLFAERGLGLGELILKKMNGREQNRSERSLSPPEDLRLSFLRKDAFPVPSIERGREDAVSRVIDQEVPVRTPELPSGQEGKSSRNY